MNNKIVYQLSAKQIILLGVVTALVTIGVTSFAYSLATLWQTKYGGVSFAESEAAATEQSVPSTFNDEQNNIDVYRQISPGVAFINTTSVTQSWWGEQEGRGNGSGSVIDTNGHILTNYHVIEGASRVSVNFGGEQVYQARVIGGDPDTDLAVIKIDAPARALTVVPLGDSDQLTVGQKVLAIGNPFGLDRTLTTGVISGLQRPIRARNGRPIDAAIQTDASINPGNSGGPLLDKNGRMIGINSQILSPAGGSVGVGFAVPVNTARRVIPQLIQYGEVRRPKLGANLDSVAALARRGYRMPVDSGLLVGAVIPGGAAANAGLRGLVRKADGSVALGDIILTIDREAVGSVDDLYRLLDRKQFNDTINVEVFRGGNRVNVPVRLTPPPSQPATRRASE
ncbi:MAG: trypsin-like peptidase domain-containing protein [Blastocatellia bacterium]|nr:trypsin-like peptidase domain-containing protein [Blastocatellia bacterium]